MAELLGKMKDTYQYIFYDLCDPRTVDWWPSPLFMFTVIPFYLYFSKSLGPRLMKDEKPFTLKGVIFYYNIFQILISGYMLYMGITAGWWPTSSNAYNWTCQPVDMADNPTTQRMHNVFWWYTVVKLIDMLDTVFFVLRKKDRQISFLHVFHHSVMPVASYLGVKYYPNGHGTLIGVLNCFVHVVMYTYYLISGLGHKYQKYLWWKRHLTTMQLLQFGIIFLHNLSALYQDCGYPKWISALLCIHSLQFLYMFGNFYYVNYIKNAKQDGTKYGSMKSGTGKSKVN